MRNVFARGSIAQESFRSKSNVLVFLCVFVCARRCTLQMEKESCEAKLSKLRLQNKARVTSLNTQLEDLKKQQGVPLGSPIHGKKVLLLTQTLTDTVS